MVIVSLTNCPPRLRGDLSKWMLEINTGVYVGSMSARVRDELWQRICENLQHGQATMVYTANNEQGMDFKIHNTTWIPVDCDGVKLVMRPLPKTNTAKNGSATFEEHLSSASKRLQVSRINAAINKSRSSSIASYAIIQLITSGNIPQKDNILEIAAIKVDDGLAIDNYHTTISSSDNSLEIGIIDLLNFISNLPVVSYKAQFVFAFLQWNCKRIGQSAPKNRFIDVSVLIRKKFDNLDDLTLQGTAEFLKLDQPILSGALSECELCFSIYNKLQELL
ncbi:MAG: CRISPR-associated endoribonuclease Cas2 [bacterium ADurb.Bin157]|nr:MAG: CRISPR-associated endoribonuclease Cas2 [bacterium ADurb.Bin157]